MNRVNTCHTLKEYWNRQWTHWSSPYPNYDPKVAPPQPDYAIGYHIRLFPGRAIRRLHGLASPSKNKLSFPVFFAELKGASGAMNVAKLQNQNNGANAVSNLLQVHQAVRLESDFYDKAWCCRLILMVRCGDFGAIGSRWMNRNAIPTTLRSLDVRRLKIRETLLS